jgi:WD40 repeat protein
VLVRETAGQAGYTSIPTALRVFSLAFSLNGRRLYGLMWPSSPNSTAATHAVTWQRALNDSWSQTVDREIPGAYRLFDSREGVVAAVSLEGDILFIGLETDQELARIPIEADATKFPVIGVSPDLRFAAIRKGNPAGGGEIEIWDLSAKTRRAQLNPQLGRAISASFGGDGRYLACSFEYGVQVYGTVRFDPWLTCRGYLYMGSAVSAGASLGGGGTVLAIPFFQENSVRLVNVESGAESARLPTGGPPVEARFSMNGSTLAALGESLAALGESAPRLLRMEENPEKLTLRGHVGGVPCVEFSPDGSLIASTGKDRKIRFWEAQTGKSLGVSEDLPGFGQTLAFTPDGKFLASAGFTTEQVQIWSTDSRKLMLTLGEARQGNSWSCVFSPDGRYLFAGGRRVRAWELEPKPVGAGGLPWELRTLFVGPGITRNLIFDPLTPGIIYVGESSQDGNSVRGMVSRTLEADATASFLLRSGDAVQSVGLVPKSGELASFNSSNRTLYFFDRQTLQVTRTIQTLRPGEVSNSPLANFKFSPDGSRVAIVNSTGRGVGVFDVASGRPLYTLPEESGAVWWLAWNPNGRRVAISQSDGDIAIWDLEQVERALKELGLDPAPSK